MSYCHRTLLSASYCRPARHILGFDSNFVVITRSPGVVVAFFSFYRNLFTDLDNKDCVVSISQSICYTQCSGFFVGCRLNNLLILSSQRGVLCWIVAFGRVVLGILSFFFLIVGGSNGSRGHLHGNGVARHIVGSDLVGSFAQIFHGSALRLNALDLEPVFGVHRELKVFMGRSLHGFIRNLFPVNLDGGSFAKGKRHLSKIKVVAHLQGVLLNFGLVPLRIGEGIGVR